MKKKISLLIVTIIIITSIITGCGGEKKTDTSTKDNTKTEKSKSNDKKADLEKKQEKITLSYWVEMHGNAAKIMKSYAESEVFKKLEEITGIEIDFIHPASGQGKEQFNLLIASNDLPDIIQGQVGSYPGGVDKAVEDGVYLKLNDLIKEHAPNFNELRQDPEIAKETITDEGNIWSFPCIQTMYEPPWAGAAVRGDWLKDLGLEKPVTMEDWDTMLRKFKKEKGADAPLFFNFDWTLSETGCFSSAYDTVNTFMNVDGKVQYGPIQPGYKDFLTQLHTWYEDGILDKDFATRDGKNMEAMLLNGEIGALITAYGSIDRYNSLKADESFSIEAVASPKLTADQQIHYRQTNFHDKGCDTVITTACKHPVEAVKWFDYHYGEEGAMLFNYGIEGQSYTMKDGKPQFTELITNNPDGLSYYILAWKYKQHIGPYKRDWDAIPPQSDIILDCMKTWAEAGNDYYMPAIVRNSEEDKKYSSLMNEINTYVEEMNSKFVMGAEPIENFDKFVEQVKAMGIDEVLKIQQAALDRYNNRK